MKKQQLAKFTRLAIVSTTLSAAAVAVTACGSSAAGAQGAGNGTDNGSVNVAALAEDASNVITLGVKYVAYSVDGAPVLTQAQAGKVFERVNQVHAQCGIAFRMEEYQAVDPAQFGLSNDISSGGNMDKIRAPFYTDAKLVIVGTGAWDHGGGPANAWAAMPGEIPMGIVMESSVVDNSNIVAHELGHYLNLDHSSGDTSNLMNPVIYDDSNQLSERQCAEMRQTALSHHIKALR